MSDVEARLVDALRAQVDRAPQPARRLVNPELTGHAVRRPRCAPVSVTAVVAAAAVLVLTLVVTSVITSSGSPSRAYAATPSPLHYQESAVRPPASDLLTHLAGVADAQLAAPPGRYHYLDTDSWSLFTRVSGGHATSTTNATPARRQVWTDDTGAGRQVLTSDGGSRTVHVPAGHRIDVAALSTDPVTLGRQLSVGHPPSNGPAERIAAVVDLWQQQAPSPHLQAAVLRVLAATRGMVDAGTVRDRAGRTGVAVSIDSDYSGLPTRYTLVLDPSTGMLLDHEEMLTTSAGELNVPVPSVVQYVVWRDHGDVDAIGTIPGSRT